MAIELYLPGTPTPKGRGRATRTGRVYTPSATRKAEDTLAGRAAAQLEAMPDDVRPRLPLAGPLHLTVAFDMPIPSSWSQRKRTAAISESVLPTSKPDLDNLLKLVIDALNGLAWVDDSQIVGITTTKRYASTPGVTVIIDTVGAIDVVKAVAA